MESGYVSREVHHSYCHINLVKKTMYQWDIVKVGIYILYLPSEIHVQKYLEEPKKNISSFFAHFILFQNQELHQTTLLIHSSLMQNT